MGVIVYGAGEIGTRLLARLRGARIAVTRSTRRHAILRAIGARPTVRWLLPSRSDALVLALPGSRLQGDAIAYLSTSRPARAVLISTVGFHAPYRGTIVPTSRPGTSVRAAAAAAIEAAFLRWMGPGGTILRLGGLYHHRRGPAAHFARTGRARIAPPDAPLPLIHYDDATTLVLQALLAPGPSIRLGMTAQPTRARFYNTLAHHLSCPPPAFAHTTGRARFVDVEPLPEPLRWEDYLPVWKS